MTEKLWGGRFRQPTAAAFERFSGSFSFDRRLAHVEIQGSRAHAAGLRRAGILSDAELAELRHGFDQLEAELAGEPPTADPGIEDVHTFVFQRLVALAGPVALKLQTGRSRNEQVALGLRLYLRTQQPLLMHQVGQLLGALADFADHHAEVLIPGYTHLQRAQPVSLGHHTLAYAEMLLRDAGRLRDAMKRMNACPLGSGALAGTPWEVDRAAMARDLGFTALTQNSLDAVSDRDFAAEFLFALSLMALHLSRWAEDWILYSSTEFGWLLLGDAYATGSSLMPQKKNADGLELIRGKSARQVANLHRLLLLLKALPLAYNRDLQEDKEAVFDAVDTSRACLAIAGGIVATTTVDAARAAACVQDPALLATDLADLLVSAGVPFHSAHQIVGAVVARSVEQHRDFRDFTPAEWAELAPQIDPAQIQTLTPAASVGRRQGIGGTAIAQVRTQAHRIRQIAAYL